MDDTQYEPEYPSDDINEKYGFEPTRLERRRLIRAEKRAIKKANRQPSLRTTIVAGSIATSLIAGAYMTNKLSNAIPSLPDIGINPGQEVGPITFSDTEVEAFRVQSTSVTGSATLKIGTITQTLIDEREKNNGKEKPHETIVLNNAKYGLNWSNQGEWTPTKTEDGLDITLPKVKPNERVTTIDEPEINKDKTHRAFWQSLAGSMGASDTQISDIAPNIRAHVAQLMNDPNLFGNHIEAVACAAIATEAEKANVIASGMDNVVVERYHPPREEIEQLSRKNGEHKRHIRFRIEHPTKPGEFLSIPSCNNTLDGIQFDPNKLATSEESHFGLKSISIRTIQPPAIEQR